MCIYGFYSISRQRERCLLVSWNGKLHFCCGLKTSPNTQDFSALKKYLSLSITRSVQKKRSFLVFLQNPQCSCFLKYNVPTSVFQRDLLFVNQLLGSGIELKDVDCGNTFERKNLITIITKSTYSHHLYSKLQTPTLIPNRAKAKWLE